MQNKAFPLLFSFQYVITALNESVFFISAIASSMISFCSLDKVNVICPKFDLSPLGNVKSSDNSSGSKSGNNSSSSISNSQILRFHNSSSSVLNHS